MQGSRKQAESRESQCRSSSAESNDMVPRSPGRQVPQVNLCFPWFSSISSRTMLSKPERRCSQVVSFGSFLILHCVVMQGFSHPGRRERDFEHAYQCVFKYHF